MLARNTPRLLSWSAFVLLFCLIFSACGSSSSPTSSSTAQPVVLKLFHWNKSDYGPAVDEINKRFHSAYPNITVQYESIPTDQYETVLKARLAGGDAPDVFGAHDIKQYAKAGYLMDLSNEPWANNMYDAAKVSDSFDNKLYAISIDQHIIGVIYNKKIFSDQGLSLPKTWADFLQLCQKLKASGTTPLALGIKDQWVDQLIPYAMSSTALYQPNPNFDQDLLSGKATFANSAWKQMMQDYLDLNKRGFFNKGALGTTYDQTVQLMALGKAAMAVNGDWIIPAIKQANPAAALGMFELPYVQSSSQPVWVPSSVGPTLAASAKTKHPDEVRKYLNFWARPDIASIYLKQGGTLSALKNATSQLDPALQEMQPYVQVGTHTFPDHGYAPGVQDVMLKDTQALFSNSITIDAMLQSMDQTFQTNKSQILQ